jgi:ACT domain-containing protein
MQGVKNWLIRSLSTSSRLRTVIPDIMVKNAMEEIDMKVIVSVLGQDRVGIVAAIAAALAKEDVNILEITQSIFKGNFTMMISAQLPEDADFATIREHLQTAAAELEMTVQMQRQELFDAMHKL